MSDQPSFLHRSGLPALAYSYFQGQREDLPTVVFLGGYRSDMQGSKALHLDDSCRKRGQSFLRFDYRGHGQSEGLFEDGTIGLWFQDALDIIDKLTAGPLVLVGSSMGGWISLLVARARAERMRGLIGIAAAPDFTKDMEEGMTPSQKDILARDGIIRIPNHYSPEPYTITRALIEDGPRHFLLNKPLTTRFPVCLIQGMQDQDVPWQTAVKIKDTLVAGGNGNAIVVLVEEGTHRLSRPEDLQLIDKHVQALS